jgi:trimeric autotransporter adhesin
MPVALAALLGAAALAGCGSSSHSDGTAADPAGVIPESAPIYLGATVRPDGSQAEAALAAGKALTHQANPYQRLLGVLRTPGSPALNYKSEVAPWLGPRAGVFLRSLSGASALLALVEGALTGSAGSSAVAFGKTGADGAIVMDTSDASAARSFLAKQAKRAGARAASYRGVSYEATAAGLAFGLVGRFAVIGSEAGLHEVIDTTQGGGALSAAPGYAKLAAAAPGGALAHLYVNPGSAAAKAGAGGVSGLLAPLTGGRQADISLLPAAGSITLDADTLAAPGTRGGLLSADPEASQALASLPGDSWLALGLGHLATNLQADVAALKGVASLLGSEGTASGLGTLVEGLLTPVEVMGADTARARSDFAGWQRSAGIFASGAGLLDLKGAIVISSNDAARSRAAVAKLGAALASRGDSISRASIPGTEASLSARVRGFPLALDIAAGRGADGSAKFVLGLGEASVGAALAPTSTLASSATRAAASSALSGTLPSVILQFPTLLSLLEGIGLTESPPVSTLVPYLRSLTTLSGGGQDLGGEVERFRLVVGLAQSGG